jgi:hypothetical protein
LGTKLVLTIIASIGPIVTLLLGITSRSPFCGKLKTVGRTEARAVLSSLTLLDR